MNFIIDYSAIIFFVLRRLFCYIEYYHSDVDRIVKHVSSLLLSLNQNHLQGLFFFLLYILLHLLSVSNSSLLCSSTVTQLLLLLFLRLNRKKWSKFIISHIVRIYSFASKDSIQSSEQSILMEQTIDYWCLKHVQYIIFLW